MSKTKFTPGPWKLIPHTEDKRLTSVIGKSDLSFHGQFVCNIATISPEHEVEQANAALIAAAPEMYQFIESVFNSAIHPEAFEVLQEQAKQVLAKARGDR